LDEAISQFEEILSKNPKYLRGYMALGTIYDQQKEWDKSEMNYRKALDMRKDFAPAANNLAWILAEKGDDIDEALGFAQIAKKGLPKNVSVMDTLGWIYYLKGSYPSAISELQGGVELAPNNPVINHHLALAYYKNNQPDEAKVLFEKALEIDNDFEGADIARSKLEEIKANMNGKP
jgi:Tfp pilus assembly protein PilF